jgi:hypothetical protein
MVTAGEADGNQICAVACRSGRLNAFSYFSQLFNYFPTHYIMNGKLGSQARKNGPNP